MKYLYAAYIATWVIHIGYLFILTSGYKKVAEEAKELRSQTSAPGGQRDR
jgi:hypothetical protein